MSRINPNTQDRDWLRYRQWRRWWVKNHASTAKTGFETVDKRRAAIGGTLPVATGAFGQAECTMILSGQFAVAL